MTAQADDRIRRHLELVGASVVDVTIDGGLVRLELGHRGCDDDACVLLIRGIETRWRYPAPAEDGDSHRKERNSSAP